MLENKSAGPTRFGVAPALSLSKVTIEDMTGFAFAIWGTSPPRDISVARVVGGERGDEEDDTEDLLPRMVSPANLASSGLARPLFTLSRLSGYSHTFFNRWHCQHDG